MAKIDPRPHYRQAVSDDSSAENGGRHWGIVLAGGSGTRLASLTTNGQGAAVPKQYCSFVGVKSLLVRTLERAERVVPRARLVIVVAEEHERFWRPVLSEWPCHNLVVQPNNRGTAAGILLPLLSILERDPGARVVLFPSDHFVQNEEVLERALRDSLEASHHGEPNVTLLGVAADSAEPEYGWIVPGPIKGGMISVDAFVEKPDVVRATELQRSGAVWNSFMLVASGETLIKVYKRRLPKLLDAFRSARPHIDIETSRTLYGSIVPVDFSSAVLEGSERFLRLRVIPPCGWTDMGTPQRVARCQSEQQRREHRACCVERSEKTSPSS